MLDLSNDWTVVDGREPITFTSVRHNGELADLVIEAHRRQPVVSEPMPSEGVYTASRCRWNLPAILCRFGDPKPGDSFRDKKGTDWTVLTAGDSAERSWWDLDCISLAIAFDLRDTIDVERPTIELDAAGTAIKKYPPEGGKVLFQTVACRAQPMAYEETEERGLQGDLQRFQVFVARQLADIDTEDRLKLNRLISGRRETVYLERLRYTAPEQLGALPTIEAVLTP